MTISSLWALPLLALVVIPATGIPAKGVSRRQSESDIEAQRDKLKPVGPLVKTQHRVKGQVYTLNDNVIVIENFVYDGRGFGVHVNVATEGEKLSDFVKNREIVGYPEPEDVDKPIEEEYKEEDKRWLIVRLPSTIKVSDVKWLSIWCDHFNLSFGHVEFP